MQRLNADSVQHPLWLAIVSSMQCILDTMKNARVGKCTRCEESGNYSGDAYFTVPYSFVVLGAGVGYQKASAQTWFRYSGADIFGPEHRSDI